MKSTKKLNPGSVCNYMQQFASKHSSE